MLQAGESLDGYRLIRPIGSGGFGEVWLCQSETVGDFRALKFIRATSSGHLEQEFEALCRYRSVAAQLRSPSIMPIEHVNRRSDGLFYTMPLSDGSTPDPTDRNWTPLTLTTLITMRRNAATWFSIDEIKGFVTPILEALQLLSDAGLVHRDVKPDNILFLNGTPCLADISLLGADTNNITHRGTPGYSAPSWFVESKGHPDMYGAATTLFSILTGNLPDKLGRAAFRWPPQGEGSLSPEQRTQWIELHRVINRAVEDRPSERFFNFEGFRRAIDSNKIETAGKRTPFAHYAVRAGIVLLMGLTFLGLWGAKHVESESTQPRQLIHESKRVGDKSSVEQKLKAAQIDIQRFESALSDAAQKMIYPRPSFASQIDAIVNDLEYVLYLERDIRSEQHGRLAEIKDHFITLIGSVPDPDSQTRNSILENLRIQVAQIESRHGAAARIGLDDKLFKIERDLSTEHDFRIEQMKKLRKPLLKFQGLPSVEAIANKATKFERYLGDNKKTAH